MKFIIFGASGFVGTAMRIHFQDKGHKVIGTESAPRGTGLVHFDLLKHRLTDVFAPSELRSSTPVIGVVCAVISQIDRCRREKKISRRVNVERTLRLIEDLTAMGAKPVFMSSSYVFDGRVGHYDEDSPHSPISEYGCHKAAVETHLRSHCPDALVLRLDKIIGDRPDQPHLLTEWHQLLQRKQTIRCIKDQVLSPTLVSDVAKAVELGVQNRLCGLYNVSNTESFARDELARNFCRSLRYSPRVVALPQSDFGFLDPRPLRSFLDPTQFVTRTGMCFTSMERTFERFGRFLDRGLHRFPDTNSG